MRIFVIRIILIFSFFCALWEHSFSQSVNNTANVLYINSYNIGYPWTDDVTAGFKKELDFNPHINYYVEFMDTKRIRSELIDSLFYHYLREKYKNLNFDVIVASDNSAVDFFISHKNTRLFKNKPLVFAGITNINDYTFEGIDAYGIVEGWGLEHIFYSMHRLFPSRKNVYVFLSQSKTDSIYQKIVQDLFKDYKESNLNMIVSNSSDSIINILNRLGNDDMVYIFNKTYSHPKNYKPYTDILTQLDSQINAPIFSGSHNMEGNNKILGGLDNVGEYHGQTIAKMAINLIHRKEIEPRIIYPKGKLIYNYNELNRFDVDKNLLPRDAKVINRPTSVINKLRQLRVIILIIVILCFAILAAMFINNHNQKKYRKNLIDARDKALESESVKTSFIANISHEIRTPLNAIIGFSDILMSENKDPDLLEFIKHIHESSKILERLVNDVLDLSLIDANEVKLNYSEIYLPEFMDELIKRNLVQIKHYNKSKLKLKLNSPEYGPKYLIVDDYRLSQILQNLINNAIKYSFSGTITVSYQYCTKEEIESVIKLSSYDLNHDQYFLFSVKDYGIGIPQEKKSFIFERFRRVDQLYLGHHGGVGLGLNISKSLLKFMGGEIWFTSVEGKGSTFSFIIPYAHLSDN